MSEWEVECCNCLEGMQRMEAASVDAIVTDPPYGLAFMGKTWDYDVPRVDIWRECLRVLKPGGHLLAFAGTRTQHRMAVNIEDAGFEIRDMIAWVYGSGFPKSLDVSKAIDKMDAVEEQMKRRYRFTEWVRSTGITSKQIDDATDTNMGGHYTTNASQPAIMTREHLEMCRHLLGDVPEWIERECEKRSVESKNFAERAVVGQRDVPIGPGFAGEIYQGAGNTGSRLVNITTPATDAAKQWNGWGTALKPTMEPITVARKPLIGTVAANVLAHGTGAINVDGCRVEGKRWPANLIHDGGDEVIGLLNDVARFFYCAKASKADRDEDNNHPTVKPTDLMRYLCRLVTPPNGLILDPFTGSGSTGKAAMLEGFRFIGFEMSSKYVEIARARIASAVSAKALF